MPSTTEKKTPAVLIVPPNEAQIYRMLGGGEACLLATGDNTDSAWWLGRFREEPGSMTTLHYHPKTDEQFYVLDGVLSVYVDDVWHDLGPGTLGVLPHGKPHAQGNRGNKPVHFIASGAPAGFENFFPAIEALLKRARPGTPEFAAEAQKIAERCDTVHVGPAPR